MGNAESWLLANFGRDRVLGGQARVAACHGLAGDKIGKRIKSQWVWAPKVLHESRACLVASFTIKQVHLQHVILNHMQLNTHLLGNAPLH